MYTKIRDDTFRTLTTDAYFKKKVSEEALIRVLNSFAWSTSIDKSRAERKTPFDASNTYVQGMNVLAAPLLYVCKSEAHAYYMFETLLLRDCALYIRPTLEGVHTGLKVSERSQRMEFELIDGVTL